MIPLSLPHFHPLPEREKKNRRRERKRGQDRCSVLGVAVLLCLFAVPARALDLRLWPLLDYHSDASGRRSVHLLGPLLSYETGDESTELTLRPLFSYKRGPETAGSELAVLYPVWISRWSTDEAKHSLLSLVTYRAQPARQPDQWDRRFTIFPLVFYRYSHILGTQLSVLPFYANVRDFLGYEQVQMIMFPFYLRLQQPLLERTWMPFPFYGRTSGPLGRGYRIWPVYGWEQVGEQRRFRYVMWPFYISYESHFTRPERERRVVSVPFFSRTDSPTLRSRSYAMFFTHTIDSTAHTDTWGFPWPLWMSQRDLNTGERTSLRIAPFYENSQLGNVHRHFIMWPVFRWETQEEDAYRYSRSDVFLVLERSIHEAQLDQNHERRLRTLFPLYRDQADDQNGEFSAPALLDALYPRNPVIERLYAPLWQLYTREQRGAQAPCWSVLWDLISSDGKQLRYPVYWNFER